MTVRILIGDARDKLRELPDASVNCIVSSPPYFGLRSYGIGGENGEIGLEPTPDEYVAALVAVFRECRRVLRDDGVAWLNIGDSYAGGTLGRKDGAGDGRAYGERHGVGTTRRDYGLKPKDLIGIPWRVAFALQADGWWLRQDIIWSKPNPMPESVTDRCTKAHEYLFLLSKSATYWYDAEAIAEAASQPVGDVQTATGIGTGRKQRALGRDTRTSTLGANRGEETRNRRSVWTVATQPFADAHFATFPPALIEPCILAGCPAGGTVLDPFGGAGTTGLVADRLGRNAILIELNPEYAAMAKRRITGDLPMFADVDAA